jgi:hypothetical protein
MKDITSTMSSYRECVRHLWNTHFWQQAERQEDWDLRDRFDEIAIALFRCLVLREVAREDAQVLPSYRRDRVALPFIRLEVVPESPIFVNRGVDEGYWDDPVARVQRDELDLRFIQFFDWWDLGFRDFAFYRARIVGSAKHPHLVGRDALLPVSSQVLVIHDDAA